MTRKIDFRTEIVIDDEQALEAVQAEIPRGARLTAAVVVLTPSLAQVRAHYLGRHPNGEEHKKGSVQKIPLRDLGGAKFLDSTLTPKWSKIFKQMLPSG